MHAQNVGYSTQVDQEKELVHLTSRTKPPTAYIGQHVGYAQNNGPQSVGEHISRAGADLGVDFSSDRIGSMLRLVTDKKHVMKKCFVFSKNFSPSELGETLSFEPPKDDLIECRIVKQLRKYLAMKTIGKLKYDYVRDPLLYVKLKTSCEELRISYSAGCNIFHMYNDSPVRFSIEVAGMSSTSTWNAKTQNIPIGPVLTPGCRKGELDKPVELTPLLRPGLDESDLFLMSMTDKKWESSFVSSYQPESSFDSPTKRVHFLNKQVDTGVYLANSLVNKFPGRLGKKLVELNLKNQPIVFSDFEFNQLKKKIGSRVGACGGVNLHEFKVKLRVLDADGPSGKRQYGEYDSVKKKYNVTFGIDYRFNPV